MLYKPTFCCNCGNKVERSRWLPWHSQRYCENCESQFRLKEWLPAGALLILTLLSGLFAFGSYLKSPEKPLALVSAQTVSKTAPPSNANRETGGENSLKTIRQQNPANGNQNNSLPEKAVPAPVALKPQTLPSAAEENIYFCGAQTKKGNPCSRKVKGGGRCWQHGGQPAMLPKEKLFAGR